MNRVFRTWGPFSIASVVVVLAILLAPNASADSFSITLSGPTACGVDGTICTGGTTAYSLTEIEGGAEMTTLPSGTYLLDNDTGISSASAAVDLSLAFDESLECQESGPLFSGSSCTLSGALGTVSSDGGIAIYGPQAGLTSGETWNPDATITVNGLPVCGAIAAACMFDVTIATVATPEPATFALLATGLLTLLGFAYFKSGELRLGLRS